jgi:hypothetical protein
MGLLFSYMEKSKLEALFASLKNLMQMELFEGYYEKKGKRRILKFIPSGRNIRNSLSCT